MSFLPFCCDSKLFSILSLIEFLFLNRFIIYYAVLLSLTVPPSSFFELVIISVGVFLEELDYPNILFVKLFDF